MINAAISHLFATGLLKLLHMIDYDLDTVQEPSSIKIQRQHNYSKREAASSTRASKYLLDFCKELLLYVFVI